MSFAGPVEPKLTPLQISSLLREQEVLGQVQSAFERRELPEQVFYWLPTSVQAWVDLCSSTEYRNANRALQLLRSASAEIADLSSEIGCVCGLGCGEGSKDAVLLEAFLSASLRPRFLAVDFSQALLEIALDRASAIGLPAVGVKADLSQESHLRSACETAHESGAPALFTVLGNTLGAFGVDEFPKRLMQHLRPGDRFLFDGEIFSELTLAGYDNPVNRRFAWGPLTGIGITEQDGRLEFSTAKLDHGLFAVTKHFTATRDIEAHVGIQKFRLRSGETIRMSSSVKYQDSSTLTAFVESAGIPVDRTWLSPDRSFALALGVFRNR